MREKGRPGDEAREVSLIGGFAVLRLLNRTHHTALYFRSAQTMPLDVDDIVHPPCDLVVPARVSQSPVPTEVESRVRPVVDIQKLLVVAIDGASHAGPGLSDTEVARDISTLLLLPLHKKYRYTVIVNSPSENEVTSNVYTPRCYFNVHQKQARFYQICQSYLLIN